MNISEIKNLLEPEEVGILTETQRINLEKPAIDDLVRKGKLVPFEEGLISRGCLDNEEMDERAKRLRQAASIRAVMKFSKEQAALFDHVGVWAIIDSGLMTFQRALQLTPQQAMILDKEPCQDILGVYYGGYKKEIKDLFMFGPEGYSIRASRICDQKMSLDEVFNLDPTALGRFEHPLARKFLCAASFDPRKIIDLDSEKFSTLFRPNHRKDGIEVLLNIHYFGSENQLFDDISGLSPVQLDRIRSPELIRCMGKKELGLSFNTVANLTDAAIEAIGDPHYYDQIKQRKMTLDAAVKDRNKLTNRIPRLWRALLNRTGQSTRQVPASPSQSDGPPSPTR